MNRNCINIIRTKNEFATQNRAVITFLVGFVHFTCRVIKFVVPISFLYRRETRKRAKSHWLLRVVKIFKISKVDHTINSLGAAGLHYTMYSIHMYRIHINKNSILEIAIVSGCNTWLCLITSPKTCIMLSIFRDNFSKTYFVSLKYKTNGILAKPFTLVRMSGW